MMKRLVACAAFLFIPAVAPAQSPDPVPVTRADSIARALQRVDSGAALRVRTSRATTRGMFSGVSDDALVLAGDAGNVTPIRFDAVQDIWKQGNYAKNGAIIGGLTGATLLTSFGLLLVTGLCETGDGCRGDYPTVVLYGIGIGGGAGALVGGGIGYLAKRWIEIY